MVQHGAGGVGDVGAGGEDGDGAGFFQGGDVLFGDHAADDDPDIGPAKGCNMDPFDKNSCTVAEYWGNLSAKSEKKDELSLQAGVEPPREYLTQPPKGYLKATQNVKATFEPNIKEDEDPRAFFREQAKK